MQHVALPHDLTVAGAADKWLKNVAADGRERATLKTYREHTAHILRRIGTQAPSVADFVVAIDWNTGR